MRSLFLFFHFVATGSLLAAAPPQPNFVLILGEGRGPRARNALAAKLIGAQGYRKLERRRSDSR